MATNYGTASSIYKFCVGAVTGIIAQGYTAATTIDTVTINNECGITSGVHTKNAVATHNWNGYVTGASPSGIVVSKVGASVSPPSGTFNYNMPSVGSVFICTDTNYAETAGEACTFDLTLTNYEGV